MGKLKNNLAIIKDIFIQIEIECPKCRAHQSMPYSIEDLYVNIEAEPYSDLGNGPSYGSSIELFDSNIICIYCKTKLSIGKLR